MDLSFDSLPKVVYQLVEEVKSLKNLVIELRNARQPDAVTWFDVTSLRNYLPDKPAESTVHGWVNKGKIPYHKGERKLRFLKSDIDAWLLQGRKKTMDEINKEVDGFFKL